MASERWKRNLIALWPAQVVSMIAFGFVLPFMPLYVKTLGTYSDEAAAQWTAVITAAGAVTMIVFQPIWGSLADRWGRKPMLVRATFGAALVLAGLALATTPEQLVAVRLFQGAATGTFSASQALVATSTPKHRLAFALGLLQVAPFIGASMGPLSGGLLADSFGYRFAFFTAAGAFVVSASAIQIFVHEDFHRPMASSQTSGFWASGRALLSLASLPLVLSLVFMIQFGGMIVTPILALFVAQINGPENAATASGLVIAATGAVSALSAVLIGRFADRIGHARVLSFCLIGAGLVYVPQALVGELWQLLVLRATLGVFLGGLMPSAYAVLATIVPVQRRGSAFGLAASVNGLSHMLAPLFGAFIATTLGMRAVFLFTAILFAGAAVWAIRGFQRSVPLPKAVVTEAVPAANGRDGRGKPGSS